MLRNRHEQLQLLVRLTDTLAAITSFALAYWIRAVLLADRLGALAPLEFIAWLLPASLALHLWLFPMFGFYESIRMKSYFQLISMVVRASAVEFFVLGALVFSIKSYSTSRYFLFLYVCVNCFALCAEKVAAKMLFSRMNIRGYSRRKVIVVGTGSNAAQIIRSLAKHSHWGMDAIGVLRNEPDSATTVEGVRVLGDLSELESVIRARAVDEVFFAADRFSGREVSEKVMLCEQIGIPIRFSIGVDLPRSKVSFSEINGMPIVTFYQLEMTPLQSFLKRSLDIGVGLVGVSLTAVLYPWIAMRIRKESPGPTIFKQQRVGENGRLFKCYKFRTMRVGAESMKAELAAANQMSGPMFKMENDPRVFPFGNFLRRTSLDELPQFVNILRGDMSVVGTRPPTPDEVSRYNLGDRRRLSIRPGLTGLWQVGGRSSVTDFKNVVEMDLKYIDHWSIWLDIKIILKTIWVVFRGRGAY